MNRFRLRGAALAALLFLPLACARPEAPAPIVAPSGLGSVPDDWFFELHGPVARGMNGAVASDDSIATAVGLHVLRDLGGNAVDAAVATAFALAVTYPEAGNIGGGGFMVVRLADDRVAALDFREEAPGRATRDMFLDPDGTLSDRSLWSHQASGVPGAVAGLWEAHREFGSLPWAALVEPAIRLAEEGFAVNDRFGRIIANSRDRFEKYPYSMALLFGDDGQPPAAGEVWRNPDLASTLRRVAAQGRDGFYRGETADLIVAEMERGGGLISHQDLAGYQPEWREPVRFSYRGHTVLSMPPASSGGITIGMMATILSAWDIGSLGWNSPQAIHLLTEAMRRAFADRNHYLGDPDHVDIPRERLLSSDYATLRRASIEQGRATPSAQLQPGPAVNIGNEGDHTTHFSVVDDEGNAVALTTTVNFLYGSGVSIEGAGFFMNNEMDDFAAQPGSPNAFGLVQGEANAVAPGKRPLSAMTPTIVVAPDGTTRMVTGARGGPRIITATFQVISNVLDFGLELPAAVAAPRLHHQHLPDELNLEPNGYHEATIAALRAMGHEVEIGGSGVAPTLLRAADGAWTGMSDPRASGGKAMAY